MLTQLFKPTFENKIKYKLKKINKLSFINNGGCGIVAYSLAKYIKKNYPDKKVEIVFLFKKYDIFSYENIQNKMPDSSMHVVIKINNLYYDSEGIHTLEKLQKNWNFKHIAIASKKLTLKSIQVAGWNPQFKRKKNVPKIINILDLPKRYVDRLIT